MRIIVKMNRTKQQFVTKNVLLVMLQVNNRPPD